MTARTGSYGPGGGGQLPRRSNGQRKVAGVAAGLAEHYGWDPVLFRIAFVGLSFFEGAGVVLYLLAWMLMPCDFDQRSPALPLSERLERVSVWTVGAIVLGVSVLLLVPSIHWFRLFFKAIGWLYASSDVVGLCVMGAALVLGYHRAVSRTGPNVNPAERSFNPILGTQRLSRVRFSRVRLRPEPGVAVVLSRPGHRLVTLWPQGDSRVVEPPRGTFAVAYRVDVAEHPVSFQWTVPGKAWQQSFSITLRGICRVSDPADIVQQGIVDACAALEELVRPAVQPAIGQYTAAQVADAARAIEAAVVDAAQGGGLQLHDVEAHVSAYEGSSPR